MSEQIQLSTIPNQSFDVVLEGANYTIRLVACFDCMAVDIRRNGVDIVIGQRLVAGSLIVPSAYQYAGFGNFILLTNDDEIPYYDQFGISQFLIYYTAADIEAANG